jgi:hypothetical protein
MLDDEASGPFGAEIIQIGWLAAAHRARLVGYVARVGKNIVHWRGNSENRSENLQRRSSSSQWHVIY